MSSDITTFNIEESIQSQYANSKRTTSLIRSFAKLIDPTPDIITFYKNIIDIDTANSLGLDNWGQILGFNRNINKITLTDEIYRTFLKIKAAANISDTSIASLNKILSDIFIGRGLVYVLEIGVMTIRYQFTFALTDLEYEILKQESLLPRAAGVRFEIADSIYEVDLFGFEGQELNNFDNGIFAE